MRSFQVVHYSGKQKRSADLLISPAGKVEIRFSDGQLKAVPLPSVGLHLKGDPPATLEIFWTDTAGENFLYCKDEEVTELLEKLSTEEPFLIRIKELRREQLREGRREKKRVAVLLGALALLLLVTYLAVISIIPAATNLIPAEWEKRVGSIAYNFYLSDKNKIRSPSVTTAIAKIVDRLESCDGSEMEFEFSVIDTPLVNAFTFPGGYLVITSKLIKLSKNAEEVAGVLAHELTHAIERHSMRKLVRKAGLGVIIGVFFGYSSSLAELAELATGLETLSFDRDQERSADTGAVQILQAAGISPSNLVSFFKTLDKTESSLTKNIPEFFNTHPLTGERIERISKASEPETLRPFTIDWKEVVRGL